MGLNGAGLVPGEGGGGGGGGTVASVTSTGGTIVVTNGTGPTVNVDLATTITAGGPTGSGTAVPVLTYNANGQLTTVTTAATVGSITDTDPSIVVGGTATAPTIATGTIDVIATQHPPAANWSNNSKKITSLANGVSAQDAAAFGQIPTTLVNQYTTSTITTDPNPGVVGTYYRCNYAASGNFTLPSSALTTGQWIMIKQIANNTLTFVGTVDGNTGYTLTYRQAVTLIWNGTNWDAN